MTDQPAHRIGIMEGDFIGPEIIGIAVEVLTAAMARHGHQLDTLTVPASGAAYDAHGHPLPVESLAALDEFGPAALLKGPFGGPPADRLSEKWRGIERDAILPLRRRYEVFTNLRPVKAIGELSRAVSPLKAEIVDGVDILIVRELLGGIYFGERGSSADAAYDTESYSRSEVVRIAERAFELAAQRRGHVTLVHKSNVLETGRFWRAVVEGGITERHPDVEYRYLHVDDAAMRLNTDPGSFDVLLTTNMFGDILSDQASTIVGGLGFCGSASLGVGTFGLYEPIHGSAPDIAGTDRANPVSAVRSVALLARHSLGLAPVADAVDGAVDATLAHFSPFGSAPVGEQIGTRRFGDEVLKALSAS